ncbi:unnamed protein product [Orchesella dallaii]|uniref:RecA family profile 1 domain-containing protein n=1 Tax=Orchesella dallaii TaxID=48710 RepID=A0ABP1QZX6_9HEXA
MEPISRLICPTLTDAQVDGLRSNGISTLMAFIIAPKETICSAIEISEAEYSGIRHSILMCRRPHPITLRQLSTLDKRRAISTGISSLDDILNGGVFPGDIIEFYGNTGCGKTQLCLKLAAQFSHFNHDKAGVLYFDMKNDFNARRLLNLCEGDESSLEKVRVFKEANLARLWLRLDDIKNEVIGGINGYYSKCRLLVIDSVPMVVYPAVEQEIYSWRYHQERLIEKLRWLADHLNLTVVLVNHSVKAWTNNNVVGTSTPKPVSSVKAAMGKYWQSKISIRIQLTKMNGSANRYEGILEKCCRSAEGQKFGFSIEQTAIL